jgi:hypothetical protein
MLYTVAVILLIAWLLGIVGTYTIGAYVHVLFAVAVVLFLVGLVKRPSHAGLAASNPHAGTQRCRSDCIRAISRTRTSIFCNPS